MRVWFEQYQRVVCTHMQDNINVLCLISFLVIYTEKYNFLFVFAATTESLSQWLQIDLLLIWLLFSTLLVSIPALSVLRFTKCFWFCVETRKKWLLQVPSMQNDLFPANTTNVFWAESSFLHLEPWTSYELLIFRWFSSQIMFKRMKPVLETCFCSSGYKGDDKYFVVDVW